MHRSTVQPEDTMTTPDLQQIAHLPLCSHTNTINAPTENRLLFPTRPPARQKQQHTKFNLGKIEQNTSWRPEYTKQVKHNTSQFTSSREIY